MALRQGEAGAPIEEICRKMGLSVGMQWELRRAVGAQWELRRALARTDQRLGHYDASMRAHVQRRFPPGDRPSGCFSNEYRQQPLRIEVVDAKRQIRRAFARPAARRRDRREMRRSPTEVDLCRRRTAERLMRAEMRVVDEADLDLHHQIFGHERPYQT